MIKKLLAVLFVVALVPAWAGCGGLPKSAVVEVDGKVITREDLDKAINEMRQQYGADQVPAADSPEYNDFQRQIAERLATEEVLWFEADKMGVSASEEAINAQVDQFRQQAGGEEQFNSLLQQNNLTVENLKDNVRKGLLFQGLYTEVTKDVPPASDEESLKYFNENPSVFTKPEMRKVRHILVADEATANQVKTRLNAGEDFAAVAREMSTDPGSKDKGGDLGEVPTSGGQFVPEFEQAMAQLGAGQTSGPVKTQFGYHIIRVDSITPGGQQTFEEVKEQLTSGLKMENERKVFDAWLQEAKGRYQIVYAEEFKPLETTATQGQAPALPQP